MTPIGHFAPSLLLLLTAGSSVAQDDPIGCFVPGECLRSLFLKADPADDPLDCLAQCQAYEDDDGPCSYFTHYSGSGFCYLYFNCDEFSDDGCDDCISGDYDCDDEICFVDGLSCQGTSVGSESGSSSADDCLSLCQSADGCGWFTYDSRGGGLCVLTETCASRDECDTCTIGSVDCEGGGGADTTTEAAETESPYTTNAPGPESGRTIMVAGGADPDFSGYVDYASVLQLTGDGNCAQLADLPEEVDYLLGLEDSEGNPIFCSGNNPVDKTQCYTYHLDDNEWTLGPNTLDPRAAAVALSDGRYWLPGGNGDEDETSEFYDGEAFTPGPRLVTDLSYGMCAAEVAPNVVFLLYGGEARLAQIEEGGSDVEWTSVPPPPSPETLYKLTCGVARGRSGDQDDVEVVLVGGETGGGDVSDQTYIFNVQDSEWRVGPAFPEGPIKDTETEQVWTDFDSERPYYGGFVLVGGNNGRSTDYAFDTVYEWDAEEQDWSLRPERLNKPLAAVGLLSVPEDYCLRDDEDDS